MKKQNNEDQLMKEIQEQYELSKNYLDPIHKRFNSLEEMYRSYINPSNTDNKAKVFDPRTFRVIETVAPRMVANDPIGSYYPVEKGDMAVANILNSILKYDWERAGMFVKLLEFVKSVLIFGTGFGRVYWDYRECEKTRMKPKKINGKMVWDSKNQEKYTYTEYDGPNFEPLNIYDCFPDPNAKSIDSMRWFIYRRFRTLKELKSENESRGGEFYKNLDELEARLASKEDKPQGTGRPADSEYREHRRVMLSTQEYVGEDESNPDIAILRRYERDRWIDYVPDVDLIILDIENPYFHGELPIVHMVDYPYPNELYGMGEIEPVERIQRAINAVLNQRLDNVQLTLNTMWKVRNGSGVALHTLKSTPGNIITTNDMNGVEPIQIPDVTGSTFVQTMNYLTSSLQNGTGITDYTSGINSSSNTATKTATGTRLIQQEANAQFKLKIQLFNKMVIEKIADQWKDLRIQYTTEEKMLRIIGPGLIKYMRDNTNLSKVDMNGEEIFPGSPTPAKLQIVDDSFAFYNLMPEDIQPSIVGDYDYQTSVSQNVLTDPIAVQENFFIALEKVLNPAISQGLAQEGKKLNFSEIVKQTFDKMQLGTVADNLISEIEPPKGEGDDLGTGGVMPPDVQQDIENMATPPEINPELEVDETL